MSPQENLLIFRRAPAALPRRELKDFAQQLRQDVAAGRAFVCMITDDRELRRLNREFLELDYPTDVLSFPAESKEGDLGEIAISSGRAAAQAAEFGHSITQEIQILMLHGVLHL
ncbi:MAG: rRNA maturation RNase YbeY, partial [Bryobacteraceae bacterium]